MAGAPPIGKSEAFTKGNCGYMLLFAAISAITRIFEGRVHADMGGIIMPFVAGGIIA